MSPNGEPKGDSNGDSQPTGDMTLTVLGCGKLQRALET